MPAKVKLAIVAGSQKGQEYVFDEHDTFLFGRMPDCHVCLPDDNCVSRHHFILEANPPDARLRDLGSLNGTYVNGQKHGGRQPHETPEQAALNKYPEVDLRDNDEIKVGGTVLQMRVEIPLAPSPEPIRCQKCGRDVSAEVGPVRQGDYVCEACRRQARADPAALLVALLAQAIQPAGVELRLPDYQIERKLGEGGMGAVYLARHKQKGNPVALKVMLSKVAVDENSRKQFMREVEVTRTLRHRNIVEFLDFGSTGSVFYFLLEYCQGGSLVDLMQRQGSRIKLAEAGPIMLQALDGLAFAHSQNIVHRDLKPQNILLAENERSRIAKVADMGLAKNFAKAGYSGMTATGSFGGSFPFMPREQVTNFRFVKPVCDVWSMGATFYNMLTGQFPRDFPRGQDPIEVILKDVVVPIGKRDKTIPTRVAEVIDRSLSSKPADRYADAGEMRQALEKAL
jgi:eukaryotic-like serine/threonine-protein kinase